MSLLKPARRLPNSILLGIVAFFVFSLYLLSVKGETSAVPYFRAERMRASAPGITNDIYNNTLGFEKIFVISLPSRTDRRDGMVLAAALSNLEIDFIDGVNGRDVPDKALLSSQEELKRLADPVIGAWRAHMNAIQEIVRRNLSSALIMEDDADWDIRIRSQLHDLALATHALTQPLLSPPDSFADPTYPNGTFGPPSLPDLDFASLPRTQAPTTSPYGDAWDVLWAGHCGMAFPFANNRALPKLRITHTPDPTVPQRQHLAPTISGLEHMYPSHTRVYHHVQDPCCSLAYAVSRSGARKILRQVGLKDVNQPFDLQLKSFCEGGGSPDRGGPYTCVTAQPGFFAIHRAKGGRGANSDITDIGGDGGGVQEGETRGVRWSVRMNLDGLIRDGGEVVDLYPDEGGEG
ncbi:glycosyltransferase family 25 protein [Annulohypoxylon maeteangense]|uniref:glycosyltransferase family 25 protein n=1 Tax=Annulohypoxylon maeteangense TaxID=1927788 RepID=UPI002007943F|nr:glycosyltransferase family 25 protein [Annulohypoxylon maeteangense]KAI0881917.1 glycosyltransferase family 25 protein [Annulohypoxylon maeteangense]